MAVNINSRARSFAIGLATVGKDGSLTFVKCFRHTEANDALVRDFFKTLVEASLYTGGDKTIKINRKQAKALIPDFKGHKGTQDFLEAVRKHGGVIVIMHRKRIPTSYEEAAMFAEILKQENKKPDKKKNKK